MEPSHPSGSQPNQQKGQIFYWVLLIFGVFLLMVGQGMAFRLPFVSKVQSYPTALRTYTMVQRAGEGSSAEDDSVDLPTREGQHIRQDISVTYNTSEEKAAQVFKAFRGADIEDIEASFIRRTFITVAQNVAGQMSLTEIISSKRTDLQNAMQTDLDIELQKQETLAKAAVAQAQGEAQSLLVKAKAQAEANHLLEQSLTSNLVQYKAVEKWNGVMPQVTSNSTPFIDLRAK